MYFLFFLLTTSKTLIYEINLKKYKIMIKEFTTAIIVGVLGNIGQRIGNSWGECIYYLYVIHTEKKEGG